MQNAFSKTASLFLSASVLYIAHGETLYWTGKDSAAPTTWSDTAANWTNSAGVASAWINGSSAEFAPSSSLSLSVEGAVEVRNFQLMRQQQITLGGSGAIVFVADGEAATNTLRTVNGQNLFFEVPVTNNVAPLKKTGFGIVYFRSQQSEFQKSFILAENQARLNGDRSLGPGDVVLTGSTSLFCEQGTSADVEAKFVQSRGTYIGTLSHADKLTLRNIGIVAGDFSRTFGFGRTGSGVSAATLALTNAASEGIGTYAMRGNFKLTFDGGTVKVAPEAGDVFFKVANNEYWPCRLYLSENGVTFGGYAATRAPLTADHAALLNVLKGVEIPSIAVDAQGRAIAQDEQMTAVGDGLATALARLKDAKPKTKIMILLSDGVSNTGAVEPDEAAAAAAKMGVKVYAIGVGTRSRRTPIFGRDFFGRATIQYADMTFDEKLLRSIARKTGGTYFPVNDRDSLEEALKEIDQLETTKLDADVYNRWRENLVWFLTPGVLCVLSAVTLSMAAARRVA